MNIHWGGRDMWFRADNNNRLSFAFAFLLWEVHNPCPVDERKRRPAFSLNGGEVPLSAGTVRGWHKTLTELVLGVDAARTRTWHALRATLASASWRRTATARTGPSRTSRASRRCWCAGAQLSRCAST